MIVYRGYRKLKLKCPVVTIGIFDGVHTGHRMLLENLVSYARSVCGESVVITFDPHPREVLSGRTESVTFLTSMDEKIKLIEQRTVDYLIISHFTRTLSKKGVHEFIRDILIDKIGMKYLVMGYDHHFGREKEGDFDTIKNYSESFGVKVIKIDEVYSEGGTVSSTAIRGALLTGKIDYANRLLGYNYQITGKIVEGYRIGRTIGFPTANIQPCDSHKLIPGDGVYAVEVQIDDELMPGMMSIGINPTIHREMSSRKLEVHIFDFNREIYGRKITVFFRFRLRDEKRFDNVEHLAYQMKLDKEQALKLLS